MMPATHPLELYRGDAFAIQVNVWDDDAMTQPTDLTGQTVAAQIRDRQGGTLVAAFEAEIALPNAIGLTLNDWPATVPAQAVWDLQLTRTNGGYNRTILAGPVRIVDDVTIP